MLLGAVIAQMRVVSSTVLWTPLNMAAVPQIYLDAEESVVTNVSGFASAISNLGAMGANGDFSQGTAASRPAILAAELNGKQVLSFDGTDDVLLGATTAQKDLFRNVGAGWAFVIYKKRTTDGGVMTRRIFHCSNGSNANSRLAVNATLNPGGTNTPALSVQRLDADTPTNLVAAGTHVETYVMILTAINYSTRAGRIYIDGALDAENTTLTASAGNTSNTTSSTNLSIGARHDGILLADIDLAAIVLSNTYPSVSDINKLFGWAAHDRGLTANLPSGHPYKTIAPTVGGFDLSIGIEWTSRTSAAANAWRSVAWSPELNLFAAVAFNGTNRVMTSPDGINWTSQSSPAQGWQAVVWAPSLGLFVAVHSGGGTSGAMTSPDGINWTSRTTPDNTWQYVTWSPDLNLFAATANAFTGAGIITSPDGINWTARTTPGFAWHAVAWSPALGLFAAVATNDDGNGVMTSPDGINWTSRTSAAANSWDAICWSPELHLFAAVSFTGTGNRVMTSPDGINWTARTSAADNNWGSICWSPERGLFVAVATTGTGNRVMTSPDGINWTSRVSAADQSWSEVVWAPALTKFVAVSGTSTGNVVMTSL